MTTNSSDSASSPAAEKPGAHMDHIEDVHTNERVPGHANYYEKDGLRTYGDDEDHDSEPPVIPLVGQFIDHIADPISS